MIKVTISFVIIAFLLGCFFILPAHSQNGKYDSLLAAMPKSVSDSVYALANKDQEYQSRGEYDSAIMMNKELLKVIPNFAPALTTIAGLYGVKSQFREEIIWAEKAIAADSNYINAYINLGNAYAGMRSYDTATNIYMTAAFVDPRSPVPTYSIAVLLEEQHEYNAALKNYLQSIKIDSTFEASYYNAAMIYFNLKKYPEAKQMLRKAMELNPLDQDAAAAYKDIEKEEKAQSQKKKK